MSARFSFDFEDDNDDNEHDHNYKNRNRKNTKGVMTKYEFAAIIGARATLLSKGAPPLVNVENVTDPQDIAKEELYAGVLPMIVTRPMPNGTVEEWPVRNLKLPTK